MDENINIQERYDELLKKLTELRTKRGNLKLKNEYIIDQMIPTKEIEEARNNMIKNMIITPGVLYIIYAVGIHTVMKSFNINIPSEMLYAMYYLPLGAAIFYPVTQKIKIDKKYNTLINEAEEHNYSFEKELTNNNNEIFNINCEIEDIILEEEELEDIINKPLIKKLEK